MVTDSVPPEPTLTVSAVARRMGVAPPTLRTWDRRYGLGPSGHTAGAHRRYTSADVARLLVMRRLTLEGVSPADAAKIAKATPVQGDGGPSADHDANGSAAHTGGPDFNGFGSPLAGPGVPFAVSDEGQSGGLLGGFDISRQRETTPDDRFGDDDLYSDSDLRDARRADRDDPDLEADALDGPWRDEPGAFDEPDLLGVLRDAGGTRGSAGGGRVVALPYGSPQSRGLARAAMALDTWETSRLLRDALRRDGTVTTWNSMIMPVLRALGERTQLTGDGIDVEHAFSEVVLASLRTVLFDSVGSQQQPQNTPPVLLACADRDYHSLPIHALAASLAERNVACRMLGTGLPPHALSASVRRTGPSVVVLFARMPGADASPTQVLRRQRPAPTIVLAGPGWRSETVPSFARTASSLEEAIDEVTLAVHA